LESKSLKIFSGFDGKLIHLQDSAMAETTSSESRIPLPFAVQQALEYCQEVFGSAGRNYMLEEVEYLEDEGVWLITVGFDVARSGLSPIDKLLGGQDTQLVRQYKKVKINGTTGEPISIHIRKLD